MYATLFQAPLVSMFLNTPPWSSDRDPQRRFPCLQTFRPLESPDVFGGAHSVISQMSLSVFIIRDTTLTAGYERLSLAILCRSLLHGLERLRRLSMASSCRILSALHLQSSTMRGSLWPFYVDRIHPSCLHLKALSGFLLICFERLALLKSVLPRYRQLHQNDGIRRRRHEYQVRPPATFYQLLGVVPHPF